MEGNPKSHHQETTKCDKLYERLLGERDEGGASWRVTRWVSRNWLCGEEGRGFQAQGTACEKAQRSERKCVLFGDT